MGADDGEVYILRPDEEVDTDDGEESWVSPQPASEVILETVADEVDADVEDFDDLEEYVDLDELAELFDPDTHDGEGTISFEIDDHEVTVHSSGDVDVTTDD